MSPGHALIINKEGDYEHKQFLKPQKKKACSFERIYFSRGTDPDIYRERQELGKLMVPQVLKSINFDLKNTVFSYIPNTAEISFLGMMSGIENYLINKRKDIILDQAECRFIGRVIDFQTKDRKISIERCKITHFHNGCFT